jgi:hypothetical protein
MTKPGHLPETRWRVLKTTPVFAISPNTNSEVGTTRLARAASALGRANKSAVIPEMENKYRISTSEAATKVRRVNMMHKMHATFPSRTYRHGKELGLVRSEAQRLNRNEEP